MKPTRTLTHALALAVMMASNAWAAKADALAAEQSFFTGKPYLPATGSYAFKYRSYQPELARWTSEDPSGFPDGANANIYAPTPTSEFDWMGLRRVEMWKQDYFTNPFGVTIGAHYLLVWGETSDNKIFTSYGYDSQQGTHTFNTSPGSYELNVHQPILVTDSNGVQHLTITSEWRAFMGIEVGGIQLSIPQGNSTLNVTITAE